MYRFTCSNNSVNQDESVHLIDFTPSESAYMLKPLSESVWIRLGLGLDSTHQVNQRESVNMLTELTNWVNQNLNMCHTEWIRFEYVSWVCRCKKKENQNCQQRIIIKKTHSDRDISVYLQGTTSCLLLFCKRMQRSACMPLIGQACSSYSSDY